MKHLLLYFEADFLELKQHFSFEHQFQGISWLSYDLLPKALLMHGIYKFSMILFLASCYELKIEKPEYFSSVKSYKLHMYWCY